MSTKKLVWVLFVNCWMLLLLNYICSIFRFNFFSCFFFFSSSYQIWANSSIYVQTKWFVIWNACQYGVWNRSLFTYLQSCSTTLLGKVVRLEYRLAEFYNVSMVASKCKLKFEKHAIPIPYWHMHVCTDIVAYKSLCTTRPFQFEIFLLLITCMDH